MKGRLFTFGCSFTQYYWPTWADILGQEYDYYENWGELGGGNQFISYSLAECIKRNNISKADTVAIMWTSIAREDRYLNGKWFIQGSVYNSPYSDEYVEKFTDPDGYLLMTLSTIELVKQTLDNIGCEYYMFKTVPFSIIDDSYKQLKINLSLENKMVSLYKDTVYTIHPSVYKVIFNNDFSSRDNINIKSAQERANNALKINYNNCRGEDWPSFDKFLNNDYRGIEQKFITEIEEQFQLKTLRDNINTKRQDDHPIPNEHLEYLQKVGFDISKNQIDYASYWNDKVLTKVNLKFKLKTPKKRF